MFTKALFYTAMLLIAILGYRSYSERGRTIQVGDRAPDFNLNDNAGIPHKLTDYTGKYLIIYFYPRNDTPICTEEACHFRDCMPQLYALDTAILGVSIDNSESNNRFSQKYKLPFPLLADTDGEVAKAYNSRSDLLIAKIAKRRTFLINPEGNIEKIYTNIDVSYHSQQILSDLKLLTHKSTH